VRAKLNYVPKDFLPDINDTSWPGLIPHGGANANANANSKAEEIIFFGF